MSVSTGPEDCITHAMEDVPFWSPMFWAMFGMATYRAARTASAFHSPVRTPLMTWNEYILRRMTSIIIEANPNLMNPRSMGEANSSPSCIRGNASPQSATADSAATDALMCLI
jgi:hypothetical protein